MGGYTSHTHCYSEHERRHYVLRLLLSANTYFGRVYRIAHFKTFNQMLNDLSNEEFSHNYAWLAEALIDEIKVIICFENYAKSKLLEDGFVIHEISPKREHPHYKNLKALAEKQKHEPVLISELIALDGIVEDEDAKLTMKSLSKNTIPFGRILRETKYLDVPAFPDHILKILKKMNEDRNRLHFLTMESGYYHRSILDKWILLSSFVDSKIIDHHNLTKNPWMKDLEKRNLQVIPK